MKLLVAIISTLFFAFGTLAQDPTYAEKLGFPKGKKVIIFHVDDAGMSYEANSGTIKALENLATSTSVMMPCGWVPQFMEYAKNHPKADVGLHIVMTSEWNNYRWSPLVGKEKAPGLYDEQGAFYHSVKEVVAHATPEEVEAEAKAQIARFRAFGLVPTHLDSHMGTMFQPKYLTKYVKLGIDEKIPVLFPGGHSTLIAKAQKASDWQKRTFSMVGQQLWAAGLPVLDDMFADTYAWNLPSNVPLTDENLREMKTNHYIALLQEAQPGLTYIIMHCADTGQHFEQISDSGPTRRGDMLAMTDPRLKAFIEKEGIILTTWRELTERRKLVATSKK